MDFYSSKIKIIIMKTIVLSTILAVFTLMVTIPAFADHPTTEVSIPVGSSTPGCEETNECYIPSEITVDIGGEVMWSNEDSASHTVTSGTPKDGPDGTIDSGLILSGQTFSHKFEESGEFPYFCLVHPWMKGTVIAQASEGEHDETDNETDDDTYDDSTGTTVMSQDGSVMVRINSDVPTQGEEATVSVEFTDADKNQVEHVNFEITIMQNEEQVLAETEQHAMTGITEFTTGTLDSNSPLDVQVTILGIGLPDGEVNWTGPIGETVSAQVVPEFGPLAMIILATAIVSIVVVTARSKVIPRL